MHKCGGDRAGIWYDVWTTANGLPQNTVTGLAQTPDGYLWLSTFDGLARFDGVRFNIFDRGKLPVQIAVKLYSTSNFDLFTYAIPPNYTGSPMLCFRAYGILTSAKGGMCE